MPISEPYPQRKSKCRKHDLPTRLKFEAEAVRLCRTSDGPRRRIAREPGCSTESLGRRLEQADVGGGRSEGPAANDLEEPGRLRRENRILRRQSAPS